MSGFAQIAIIITFVVTLFILYRILVSTKDAMIELLKEKLSSTKEQLEESKKISPDILAENLSKRVKMLTKELMNISASNDQNTSIIKDKESQLFLTTQDIKTLKLQLKRAEELMEEFFCPYCKAPMVVREYQSEYFESDGRDIDIEHENIEYDCGLNIVDGKEFKPCSNKK